MLLFIAAAATAISILLLLFSPANGVLFTFAFKPVIDATWDKYFMGINCLKLIGAAFPVLILPRIMFSQEKGLFSLPLSGVGTLFFFSNLIGILFILVYSANYSNAAELFFRSLNAYVAIFLFSSFFCDRESFKKLLIFLLIAGLFPVGVGIFQALTGKLWQHRQTVGLIRNVGLYHDSFNIRAYGYQTISAILLYISYYCSDKSFKKILLYIYAGLCSFMIFKGYSKAGVTIFVIWTLCWSTFNKKILWLLLIPIIILGINFATDNKLVDDMETLFSKEIGVYSGVENERKIFSGRGFVWESIWESWKKKDILKKMFGAGRNPGAHNEYLRILYVNGIFGLTVFIIFLFRAGSQLLSHIKERASPLRVMGIMIFLMYFVDTIGLHPSIYPAYNWYVWGFIGLALSGVEGLEEENDQK